MNHCLHNSKDDTISNVQTEDAQSNDPTHDEGIMDERVQDQKIAIGTRNENIVSNDVEKDQQDVPFKDLYSQIDLRNVAASITPNTALASDNPLITSIMTEVFDDIEQARY